MLTLKHGVGYLVVRMNGGNGEIAHLSCRYCKHQEVLRWHRRGGDRSGQPKFNRARAAMVKHLYATHRAELDALAAALTTRAIG